MKEEQIWNFLMNYISIKTFIAIVVIYFLIVWIAVIVWVIKDINSRTQSIFFIFFSIFTVIILGPLGVLIYLLLRPHKTFYEKYYEEVEGNIDYLTDEIFKKLEEKEKTISKKKNTKKSKKKK